MSTTFGRVVVVGEKVMSTTPMYEQVAEKLVNTIKKQPRFPLTPTAEFSRHTVDQLPAETREALQPFIEGLRARFALSRGAWQAEFYGPMGFNFAVIYLE